MSSVLIDWVTETHRRIREEIADNYERLGGEFRHSHQYWVNADILRRIVNCQRRASGAVVVTNDCGAELDDQRLAETLDRWGGEMLVIVWMERAQDATMMELAVR